MKLSLDWSSNLLKKRPVTLDTKFGRRSVFMLRNYHVSSMYEIDNGIRLYQLVLSNSLIRNMQTLELLPVQLHNSRG